MTKNTLGKFFNIANTRLPRNCTDSSEALGPYSKYIAVKLHTALQFLGDKKHNEIASLCNNLTCFFLLAC